MNTWFDIQELFWNYTGYSKIRPITLTLLIILIVFNSCIKIDLGTHKNRTKVEGYVRNIISHEALDITEVQILEWHEGFLWGGPYSIEKDSCYTDAKGHFLINFNANDKYSYTLRISRDMYFKDEGYPVSLTSVNQVNIGLFPHGFIKTHITNKIDTAQYIEIFITPFYSSQEIFRDGFINCSLFKPAFADTSFITTTIGGVINQLKILIYSVSVPDSRVVKDTSFLTLRHDTVHLNIILK